MVVAGAGASRWSDDGAGNHTVPLIARISADGELKWQRVFHELANQSITAIMSVGEEQYVVLEESSSRPDIPLRRITLRRIDEAGNASAVIVALEPSWVTHTVPVRSADPPYFLLDAKRGSTSRDVALSDVRLFRLDLRGRVDELSIPAGIRGINHLLHFGRQELLVFPVWQMSALNGADPKTQRFRSDVTRLSSATGSEVLLTLVNKQCQHIAASQGRLVCSGEYGPAAQIGDAVAAYSLGGQELWRHELGSGTDAVQQLLALDSGEVLYAVWDIEGTHAVGLDRTGRPAWRQTVRSNGEHTFLSAIEPLRNGRLAFLGSTGPWNPFGSTDTSAMLIVVDAFGDDVNASPIAAAVDGAQ